MKKGAEIPDPTGRFDVLVSSLIDRAAPMVLNPVELGFLRMAKPRIDAFLTKHIGPEARKGRKRK